MWHAKNTLFTLNMSDLSMPVPQLCHRPDGIEPGILAQRVGDDLQRLREGLEAVGVGAGERVGVEHELT